MKHLLELNEDYIIETQFKATTYKSDTGKYLIDWEDKELNKAKGIQMVNGIILLRKSYYRNSDEKPSCKRIWLSMGDVLALADKLREMDNKLTIGEPTDELPF